MRMPAASQRVNPRHTVSDLALIAALGSDKNANWWNCSFLSQLGLDSLVYNFPRTSVSAAISSTCKAASQIHDTATGSVDVYHLFRLPSSLMSQLQRSLITESSGLREVLLDKNRCLQGVRELSDYLDHPPMGRAWWENGFGLCWLKPKRKRTFLNGQGLQNVRLPN